jgi:hypothetical protein
MTIPLITTDILNLIKKSIKKNNDGGDGSSAEMVVRDALRVYDSYNKLNINHSFSLTFGDSSPHTVVVSGIGSNVGTYELSVGGSSYTLREPDTIVLNDLNESDSISYSYVFTPDHVDSDIGIIVKTGSNVTRPYRKVKYGRLNSLSSLSQLNYGTFKRVNDINYRFDCNDAGYYFIAFPFANKKDRFVVNGFEGGFIYLGEIEDHHVWKTEQLGFTEPIDVVIT